jgi:hypothetical protein
LGRRGEAIIKLCVANSTQSHDERDSCARFNESCDTYLSKVQFYRVSPTITPPEVNSYYDFTVVHFVNYYLTLFVYLTTITGSLLTRGSMSLCVKLS